MLSCKALVARASEFLDGELGIGQRMSVRMHLVMCRHCRRFIKQMRLSQAVLRKLPQGQNAELDALAAKLAELRRQHS
jgi:anti-sigma factor ChrR (cupin superfamily)